MGAKTDNLATTGMTIWRRHAPTLCLIVVLFLVLHLPFFHRFGTLVNDTGKELGVPLDLLAGRVLYRDTFWPYGPFPPYATAALFRLFGAHFDVVLVQARLLSLAICLLVYAGLAGAVGRATAVLGVLAVLGFSTTSGLVAVPYSFATLWATVLLLAGWVLLEWAKPGTAASLRCWVAAGVLTGMVGLCKISVAPVLVAVAAVYVTPLCCGPQRRAALAFIVPAALLFLAPLVLLASLTDRDSFALQALAGFHKENIVQGGLYRKLADAVLLRQRVAPEDAAAAASTLLVVVLSLWAMAAGLARWGCGLRNGGPDRRALAVAVLAAGNLAQLNSTVHAPYLFPGALLAWALVAHPARRLIGGKAGASATPAGAGVSDPVRPGRQRLAAVLWMAMGAVILLLAAALAGGRARAAQAKSVLVRTPTYVFWHQPADAAKLVTVLRRITDHTRAGEAVAFLEGYDYLGFLAARPNPSGYYYTWYEPFHCPRAAARLRQRFAAAQPRLIVFTEQESFSYTYSTNCLASDLCTGLLAGYQRDDVWQTPPFILWWRKDTPR